MNHFNKKYLNPVHLKSTFTFAMGNLDSNHNPLIDVFLSYYKPIWDGVNSYIYHDNPFDSGIVKQLFDFLAKLC